MGTTRRGLLLAPSGGPTGKSDAPPPRPQPTSPASPSSLGLSLAGRAGCFSGSEVPEPQSRRVTWGAGGHAPVPSCPPPGSPSCRHRRDAAATRGGVQVLVLWLVSRPRLLFQGAALGHRGGREGAGGQPPSAAPAGRVGTGNKDRETHGPGLPQEVWGRSKRARADKGGPRRPTSPVTAGSGKNSRSFLNSRCRLHGRPYGLTQGFTN